MAPTVDEKTSTAVALRAEMAPSGLLQTILVDQIALGMDRLASVAAREDRDDPAWLKAQTRAERTFYRALTEFRRLVKAEAKARRDAEGARARAVATTRIPNAENAAGDVTPGPDSGSIDALRRLEPGRPTALGSPIERGSRGDVGGSPRFETTRGGVADGSGPAPSPQRWGGPDGLAMPPSPVFRR